MRITTSPYIMSNKGFSSNVVSPVSYNSNITRSSSLTNSDIMHKRLVSDRQNNQNSYLLINDNSKYSNTGITKQLIQKSITNEYGIPQNQNFMEQKMNSLSRAIQQINKKLNKHSQDIKTLQNNVDQNQLKESILQKIKQQIQVKLKKGNQGLLLQINQINKQIYQRVDEIKSLKTNQLTNGTFSTLNQSGFYSNHNEKPVNYDLILKKVKKAIDQKLNSQIFKLKLFVQNEVFKTANSIKNGQNNDPVCLFTKSTLKYSFKPLKLVQRHSLHVQDIQAHGSNNKQKQVQSSQKKDKSRLQIESEKRVYYLDHTGYLIDEAGYYLLDKENKMIKVSKAMLQKLKQMDMLK